MRMLSRASALAILACAATSVAADAATVSINFDGPQAGYTPNGVQDVFNQFASLGLLIRDAGNPSLGATVGDCTGGVGSDPVHLYGHSSGNDTFSGCGDTTPNIDFVFVDPANAMNAGFTTAFSILITDGFDTLLTAYDVDGNVLGSAAPVNGGLNERIGVSGIGQISRVNVRTLTDFTAYDDLVFGEVQALGAAVPEPATWAMMIGGFGLIGAAARRRARATVTFA